MEPCHSHTALQHTTVVAQPEPMHIRTRLTRVRRVDAQIMLVQWRLSTSRWPCFTARYGQGAKVIRIAAHALSFASPLGPIDIKLRPFSHRSDASCLGLRGLGQVDAPHGIMDAIDVLQGDSLYCKQTSRPSLTSTRRCIPSTSVGAVPAVLSTSRVHARPRLLQRLLHTGNSAGQGLRWVRVTRAI